MTLGNGTELFRIRARARRGEDPEPRPVLVTRHQDGSAHTYEPLSSGGDRRGLLRLAYTVPTELVGPATAFALDLPDGHRITLPTPAPGVSRAEPGNGQQRHDSGQPATDAGIKPSAETRERTTESTTQLERELAELRSTNEELRRRVADVTAEHAASAATASIVDEELGSLRGAHEPAGEELRSTRDALAKALGELDAALGSVRSAQAERDQAVQRARSAQVQSDQAVEHVREAQAERDDALAAGEVARRERDEALVAGEVARGERDEALAEATTARAQRDQTLGATREAREEHDRLTGRLRQYQARIELLRADAKRALPGADPRLRQLESEREQLTTHVRALAELLSVDVEADAAPDPAGVVANGAADGLATLRARAVRDANEQAEHELGRLRATTPR